VIEAAVSYLQEARERDSKESAAIYEDLTRHYYKRLAALQGGDGYHEERAEHERYSGLSLEALRTERGTAIRLRDEGRIHDEVLRRLERELDLSESQIARIG
jgi:CPA1 family monovalent cation:H+ antiporter